MLEPVLYTTLAAITIHPLPCSDVPLSEKWYHAAGVPAGEQRLHKSKRNAVSNLSPVQSLTKEQFQTVVSKINAVWNRSQEKNFRSEPQAQPMGVSKHSPESKRSLEPLSRKETLAQSAVKNRIAV